MLQRAQAADIVIGTGEIYIIAQLAQFRIF